MNGGRHIHTDRNTGDIFRGVGSDFRRCRKKLEMVVEI